MKRRSRSAAPGCGAAKPTYRCTATGATAERTPTRPDFQRLMADVESGRVSKIIVYKLDRMSRSVLDFELTYRELKRHHVDFVSATEDFDTTSITGRSGAPGDTHIRAAGA